jgi:outer membrane receptor protein involved in Fe transport
MTKEKIYPFLSLCVRYYLGAAVGIMTFMLPSFLTAQEAQDEEDADLVELDIFTVEATETVGYRATNAISATRLNTSLLEIPQTINVLTADFLEDVNAFSPRDASRWVTNVHPRTNNHQPGVFIIRGQQHNLVYVDGYRAAQTERDTAPFSRMEVIKGPASSIVGRGEATGVINWVRKRPSETTLLNTKVTVGTENLYRFDIDAGGPLNESKTVSYRAVAFYHNSDGHIDFERIERGGFYPSVMWRPTEKTMILFQGEIFNTNTPNQIGYSFMWNRWVNAWRNERFRKPSTGLDPFLLGIDRSFSLDGPGSFRHSDIYSGNVIAQHQFTDWVTLRIGATAYQRDRHNVRFQGIPSTRDDPDTPDIVTSNELLNRRYREEEDFEKEFRSQGDLIFQYKALSGKHLTLFGYEVRAFSADRVRVTGGVAPINLLDVFQNGKGAAVYDQTVLNRAERNTSDSAEAQSFFIAHESHFFDGFLTGLYGWRWDRGESWNRNRSGVESFRDPDETTAPRWGVTIRQ